MRAKDRTPETERTCAACAVCKPITEFYERDTKNRTVRARKCKVCVSEKRQAYRIARWRCKSEADPFYCTCCKTQKTLGDFYTSNRGVAWSQCKSCVAAYRKQQRDKDPVLVAKKLREARLRLYYGMTTDGYNALLAQQGGGCAICGARENAGKTAEPMPVDHCHATGQVRGILCDLCNQGLGSFHDAPERLMNAAAYLRASKAVAHA